MKKIIIILFLFLMCLTCYIIYSVTEDNNLYITSIGDNVSYDPYFKNNYNTDYVNDNYHISDILNILTYNIEDNHPSIHQILKKTDILIISIGMNDIKFNDDTKEIYTYLNNMIHNYEKVLLQISKYDYQKVYILGYYNIINKNNDLYTYINYKLKKLAQKYHYIYIDTNKILYNNPKYLKRNDSFYLNDEGISKIHELIVENL